MESFDTLLNLAQKEFSQIDPSDVIARYSIENKRPSLYTPTFNHLLSIGSQNRLILDPPTSDDGSDEERSYPSVQKVADCIVDSECVGFAVPFI